jgi:uncharacterized membrane protein YfcA
MIPMTEWHFYAVAVPAVLLLGISKSGFGAGFGSLAVPLMAMVVTVPQAAAILMPVLLVMDLLGIAAFRKDFDRALLKFLLPWGLLGIVIGTLSFRLLQPRWAGALLSATSGFTSFVAHAGGPPINAYAIPLRLTPVRFTGTMAFYFFAINLAKWMPYGWLGLLDWRNLATSLVLLPLAPLGVWTGVRIARRIDQKLFYRFIYVGMLLTGIKLVWDALSQ